MFRPIRNIGPTGTTSSMTFGPPSAPTISLNNLAGQHVCTTLLLAANLLHISPVSSDDMSEWRLKVRSTLRASMDPITMLLQSSNSVPPAQPQFQRRAPVTEVRRIPS
ncbi:hypothetical protein CSOJ01_13584 [Colletotrichum sojae]|uniref:Uncharacterized protein n=1 Tax=Colletotrichum sojae TaxID=2175907 RepID=A0A8H6IST1_9PEZI|nr:hypothetical protein CSOJ01_13584 [Colletotrichum sojae]